MVILGEVVGVFSAKEGESGLPRPKRKFLHLKRGYGIEDDKFAGKKLEQAVMVVGMKAYNLAESNGIELKFGSLGENILFDFDPHDFVVGTEFRVGESLIKITENCTLCNHLSIFDKRLPKIVKFHRGVYCEIVKSGRVEAGETVTLG
jgi:MOSC domain-containing protein YiiM